MRFLYFLVLCLSLLATSAAADGLTIHLKAARLNLGDVGSIPFATRIALDSLTMEGESIRAQAAIQITVEKSRAERTLVALSRKFLPLAIPGKDITVTKLSAIVFRETQKTIVVEADFETTGALSGKQHLKTELGKSLVAQTSADAILTVVPGSTRVTFGGRFTPFVIPLFDVPVSMPPKIGPFEVLSNLRPDSDKSVEAFLVDTLSKKTTPCDVSKVVPSFVKLKSFNITSDSKTKLYTLRFASEVLLTQSDLNGLLDPAHADEITQGLSVGDGKCIVRTVKNLHPPVISLPAPPLKPKLISR